MKRPEVLEYAPYFQYYIDLVGEGDFFILLNENTKYVIEYFENVPNSLLNHRYAENKWTIKEVLMHIIDTERAFAFRAFVCARGDAKTPLHGMDENLYASNIDVTDRTIESLLNEFVAVRNNSKTLFDNLSDAQSQFLGNAITYKISARALGYLMIGHVQHHINIISERYL
jgi:uncharacterized damage-inducible protein DinB